MLNQYNFKNIIWIRDGQKVVRLGVELDFDNAVFPDPKQQTALISYVQDSVWQREFSPEHYDARYSSTFCKEKTVFGLKKKPEEEEEPYEMKEVVRRFTKIEDWLASDSYRLEISDAINQGVVDYLRKKNNEQLTFVVMLQGLVDLKRILDIPPGTDLFNFDVINQHFELLYDYTHGLPDRTYRNLLEPYLKPKVGDWIIANKILGRYEDYGDYDGNDIRVYKIIGMKDGQPVVHHHPKTKRYSEETVDFNHMLYGRVKTPRKRVLREGQYLRHDLPRKLAAAILDDREWKQEHTWLVPVLDQWPRIQKQYLVNPINFTPVEMKVRR